MVTIYVLIELRMERILVRYVVHNVQSQMIMIIGVSRIADLKVSRYGIIDYR